MAGHSHWAGIKHKKAVADAKRGKVFSKMAKLIIAAAKTGGPNPDANFKLAMAIDRAKEVNMPKANIDRLLKRIEGGEEGANFEEIFYEGYGPGGVAVLVEVLTDNRNRTAGEIRKAYELGAGKAGAPGCVAWMFERCGLFTIKAAGLDEDKLLDDAIEVGAKDVERNGDIFEITTESADFHKVLGGLNAEGYEYEVAEITYMPKQAVAVDERDARKLMRLIDEIENLDDVQNVYANFEMSEEVMLSLE